MLPEETIAEKILLIFEILRKLEHDRQDDEDFMERRRIGYKSGENKQE